MKKEQIQLTFIQTWIRGYLTRTRSINLIPAILRDIAAVTIQIWWKTTSERCCRNPIRLKYTREATGDYNEIEQVINIQKWWKSVKGKIVRENEFSEGKLLELRDTTRSSNVSDLMIKECNERETKICKKSLENVLMKKIEDSINVPNLKIKCTVNYLNNPDIDNTSERRKIIKKTKITIKIPVRSKHLEVKESARAYEEEKLIIIQAKLKMKFQKSIYRLNYRRIVNIQSLIKSRIHQVDVYEEISRIITIQVKCRMLFARTEFKLRCRSIINAQAIIRSHLDRQMLLIYQYIEKSIIIQATWKMKLQRNNYASNYKTIIFVQSSIRNCLRCLRISFFKELEKSSIIIQSKWRMKNQRSAYVLECDRINEAQKLIRSFTYRKVLTKNTAAVSIQCYWKMKCQKSAFQFNYKRIFHVQTLIRGHLDDLKRKSIFIQSQVRMIFQATKYECVYKSIMNVQSSIRSFIVQNEFSQIKIMNLAAIIIQANWKMIREKSIYETHYTRIKGIQSLIRGNFIRMKILFEDKKNKSTIIQANWRRKCQRIAYRINYKKASITQTMIRGFNCRKRTSHELDHLKKMCIVIQSIWRMKGQRASYNYSYRKIIDSQSLCRRFTDRHEIKKKDKEEEEEEEENKDDELSYSVITVEIELGTYESVSENLIKSQASVRNLTKSQLLHKSQYCVDQIHKTKETVAAATVIQATIRMKLLKTCYALMYKKIINSQSLLKGCIERMKIKRTSEIRIIYLIIMIQSTVRHHLERMKNSSNGDFGSIMIQSWWRMAVQRGSFLDTKLKENSKNRMDDNSSTETPSFRTNTKSYSEETLNHSIKLDIKYSKTKSKSYLQDLQIQVVQGVVRDFIIRRKAMILIQTKNNLKSKHQSNQIRTLQAAFRGFIVRRLMYEIKFIHEQQKLHQAEIKQLEEQMTEEFEEEQSIQQQSPFECQEVMSFLTYLNKSE
ncbi:uncharacterized protein LOC111631216 [Centruroides sculpturatus]|uniref:uncharacterized protein LOC111631216 n=1 Tax=Centruroides sculpturatus TaxID=218467 RepID=UPI000C6DA56D|nr:uncharacterized protein LOC111631216 [Centruroides sculpturatus]